MRTALLLSIALLSSTLALAQPGDTFSEKPDKFMEQLEDYMTAGNSREMEDVYKLIERIYKDGGITPEQMALLRTTAIKMQTKKLNPSPYFRDYAKVVLSLLMRERSGGDYEAFHQAYHQMIDKTEKRRFKPLQQFLRFSINFYTESALYKSSNNVWIAKAPKYELVFEEDTLRMEFPTLDLVGYRGDDSVIIAQTKGTFLPTEGLWRGEGGTVSWERVEQPEVYCELTSYEFELSKNTYTCEDAILHHPTLFPGMEVKGAFKDRIVMRSRNTPYSFPRFESYTQVLTIDNFGEGIEYIGGFRLEGNRVNGFGTKEQPARLNIYKLGDDKQRVLKAEAERFIVRSGERIVAEQCATTLYIRQDSIYHPSSNLLFDIQERSLSLTRGERGSDRNPFEDSYHGMQIYSDQIDWQINTDSIVIGQKTLGVGGGNDKTAIFESDEYFSDRTYRGLQNISTVNPLATLGYYSRNIGTTTIPAIDYAKKLNPKYKLSSIKSLLYDLAEGGFILYDSEKEIIEVQEKVFHYADAAMKKVDYDGLSINSKTKETNAVLYLDRENDIMINDVNHVELSPTQRVAVKPTGKQLMVRGDRNMELDGEVFAGLSTFTGKDFHFNYGKFNLVMDSIRYLDLFETSGDVDENENPIAFTIGSRIENLSGVLLIDAPNNKSGREDIAIFPSFNSSGPSYIYYDRQEGMEDYGRDSFYFELKKFSFNSLDNYSPDKLAFKGKLVSADIFPEIEEVARLQEDKSLGFVTETDPSGLPTYKGKGNYKGKIGLSNEGFGGEGNLSYLTASFNSDDINFAPNRMTATAERFDMEESREVGNEVPEVRGVDVAVEWKPYRDSMYVESTTAPFTIFPEGVHKLEGQLILTPDGLRGRGLFDWDKGSLRSNLMAFGAHSVESDTAELNIRAQGTGDKLAFNTTNMNGRLDFDTNMGKFKSNDASVISTTMPYNQYKTSMSEFTWDMEGQFINFISQGDGLSDFLSIHPDQDSLIFQGKTASYDLRENVLKVASVPFIKSADALIYTETGDVEVRADAVMSTLENATIIASESTKYHVINRATVKVKGKKDYTASGFYEYNIGDRKQEIEFSNIIGSRIGKGSRADKAVATRASGEVEADQNFYIDLKTLYKGEIKLSSDDKALTFDGYAKFDMPTLPRQEWFNISSTTDKNSPLLRFNNPQNEEEIPLRTGLFASKALGHAYPSIMAPTYLRKDRVLFDTRGVFKYERRHDQLVFGDSLKVIDSSPRGNRLTYAAGNGSVAVEGVFTIVDQLPQVQATVVGVAKTKVEPYPDMALVDSVMIGASDADIKSQLPALEADFVAALDMPIPDKLLKIILADIRASSFDLPYVTFDTRPWVARLLSNIIDDEKQYDKTKSTLAESGRIDLDKQQKQYELLWSHLPMKWHADYQSFVSREEKLGLASIRDDNINRMIEAYVEFRMPSDGKDGCHIYIKVPGAGNYYYLSYKGELLRTVSNNAEYMETLDKLKSKEKTLKTEAGDKVEVEPVNPGTADLFARRVKNAW